MHHQSRALHFQCDVLQAARDRDDWACLSQTFVLLSDLAWVCGYVHFCRQAPAWFAWST